MTDACMYLAGIKARADVIRRCQEAAPNDCYDMGDIDKALADADSDLPRVADALLAVLELHEPCQMFEYDDVFGRFILDADGNQKVIDTICRECTPEEVIEDAEDWSYDDSRAINYPCPTVKAITEALEGTK